MGTGSVKTTDGKKIMLYRAYTETSNLSTTQYLPETQFVIGMNNGTPSISSIDLDKKVPIGNGTVCDDGSNVLTGSSGGTNTTSNTSTYKEGAGTTDKTGQNLIANDTSVTKKWEIADLSSAGNIVDSSKYIGLWFYIIADPTPTTLSKFLTSGTCLEIRIGADTTANYYSKTYTVSDLSTGWNWLCDNELLSTWTSTGTPGTLDHFAIIITTNNATDTFAAGDVVFDLLRQWEETDFYKDFQSGYPSLNFSDMEATQRGYLASTECNGFNVDGLGTTNEDTTKLLGSESTHTSISKSLTDEIAYICVDRIL